MDNTQQHLQIAFELQRLMMQEGQRTMEILVADRFESTQKHYKLKLVYNLDSYYRRIEEARRQREKAKEEQLLEGTDYEEVIADIESSRIIMQEKHPDIDISFYVTEVKHKGEKTFFKGRIPAEIIEILNKEREIMQNYQISFIKEQKN